MLEYVTNFRTRYEQCQPMCYFAAANNANREQEQSPWHLMCRLNISIWNWTNWKKKHVFVSRCF